MNSPPPTQLRVPTTAEQEALQRAFRGLRDSRDSVANARNTILGIAWGEEGKTLSCTEQVVNVSMAFSVYASAVEAEGIQLSNILRVIYVANDVLFCAKAPKGLQDQMKEHISLLLYAASKVPTTDDSQVVKLERIINLWRDKGVYGNVDDLLSALRGELSKAKENVPAPETAPDVVDDPADAHQSGGEAVCNLLTQHNAPNFIPPTAPANFQHQMPPAAPLQPPKLDPPPQQPAPAPLLPPGYPPPDFQQYQNYQKLPLPPPGLQQPPVHVQPPPVSSLPAPGAPTTNNFPSKQLVQSIPNQPMKLPPLGMQQPWVPLPMQSGIIPPPAGMQLPLPMNVPGVGLPPMPLPPPSQGFFPPPMQQPPPMPPLYPPPRQTPVIPGVQFLPPIPVMPMPMLNPSPAKPKSMDELSGGQLVHIITAAIDEEGYKPYSPLPQQAEPKAPLMSPRKAEKVLDRVDMFCSRLSRDKEDRDTRGRSERRRSSRSRSRSPKNNGGRRSRSRSRSWSPRRSSRNKRR